MWGRITALVLLALGLAKTLLLGWLRPSPLAGFSQRYGSEGIVAVREEQARILARAGTCIACGRCDAFEGERVSASHGKYRGLMHFVLSGVRSLPDFDAAADSISTVPREALIRAESQCPVGVPLVELAHLVRGGADSHRGG